MSSNGSARRGAGSGGPASKWVAVGVSALGVVTIVLVVLALTQFRTPAAQPAADQLPTESAVPSTEPSAVESTVPPPPPPRVVPVPTRLIGAVDADRAYRTEAGECPDLRAASATSDDGGATWLAMDVSGVTNSSAALAFSALEADFASIVTLSVPACEPQLVRTFVGGISWEISNGDLPATWYFDPRDPATVHTPDGERPTPCSTVALAAQGDLAAVLCTDERIFISADRGATWPLSATVAGASAISAAIDGFDVAVLNQGGCAGVQVVPLTADLQVGTAGSCLAQPIPEGAVALSTGADGELWAWAGELVARSGDRGITWR